MTAYEIAKGEIGTKEVHGDPDNQRIVEYHQATSLKATDDETPWCSSFVNWCFKQVGIPGTGSAAARSWLKWGMTVDIPQEGDLVIFRRGSSPTAGHVAFFVKSQGTLVYVLGGNQSDQVKVSAYKRSDVIGYRRAAA